MYINTWYEIGCPQCKKTAFYCIGDTSDITGFDPECFLCPECKYSFDYDGNESGNDLWEEGVILVPEGM